jgi:hypothetical protein
MPILVTYNASVVTLPPRLERIVLYLLAHQETICQAPACQLEFNCGLGAEVKGRLRIDLTHPENTSR